ncbi:MAG: hypothetical protein RL413_1493, partial [Actinomycetota bacterium]
MTVETPAPENLEDLLSQKADAEAGDADRRDRREFVRAENLVAAKYWGDVQARIIVTFLVFGAAYTTVIVLGATGRLPLWLGLIVNSVLASTFYMPMHEATHKNIMGKATRGRMVEDAIGYISSIPTGI